MNFRELVIIGLLIALFAISIMTFSYNFSAENGANVTILSDSRVNSAFGNLEKQLNDSSSTAQTQRVAVESEVGQQNPSLITALGFYLSSILTAGTTFITMGYGLFDSIFQLASQFLGIPPIVIGTLVSILIVTFILAVWRVWRAGE